MDNVFIPLFFFLVAFNFAHADKVCDSINIQHESDLKKLRDCTIINGNVRLTNLKVLSTTNLTLEVEEITGYLMVYRVDGLKSLEVIFPNLTIIRGQELLFDKYSLVIYENRDMRDIGLKSLLKIRKGSVQIEANPVLCFVDTVIWLYIFTDNTQQHYSLKNNKDPNECPLCLKVKRSETEYYKSGCWSLNNYQRKKPILHSDECSADCGSAGCTIDGKTCCSPYCLTGCFAQDCRICSHYKTLEGHCIENCKIPNYTLADQCLTEEECRSLGRIPHAGACASECPRSYKETVVNGLVKCTLLCNRNFTIRSRDDLEDVKDCVTIRGSLHIELKDDQTKIIGELESALGEIKEITGYLKITKSPQLVTLGFFKSLDTINGEQLIDGEISFYVVDNFHLEEIWPDNHKVAILKGRLFFHLNPRLCFDKILQLASSLKSFDNIRVKDASRNSNGERVICGGKVRPLFPVVEDKNATAVRIKVDPLSSSDKDVVLGYLHYYKEAPVKNVTMYDGRHGCGRDNWRMDMTLNRNIRHILSNLKPYTQYAYFVKTITMVDYHMQQDWYSSIQYFKTLPTKPGPVQKMYSNPLAATAVIVHWWPPLNPNGAISRYILHYEPVQHHINHSQVLGYNSTTIHNRDCDCDLPKESYGPPPDDLTYYNRDQVIVDEAFPNLIFVSSDTIRRLEEDRIKEDKTRRKRESSSEGPNTVESKETTTEKNNILTKEQQDRIDEEKATELRFRLHLEEIERKSLLSQDTGKDDYPILHTDTLCETKNNSENCGSLDGYKGIRISADRKSYIVDELKPDTVYKISIKACVEELEDPCGPERSIEVETVSSKMEYFLNGP